MKHHPGLSEIVPILERLVAFDTESAKSNLDLVDYVEAYIRERGIAPVRILNPKGDKALLFATIGSGEQGGICLSGHTDVVPVAGQRWATDPFRLHVSDGRAYGRGAVDMKAFCAIALAHLDFFLSLRLTKPVHLLFTYDEETNCFGARQAVEAMGTLLPRPDAIVVGEPTSMRPADAHKSCMALTTNIVGTEAHSSKPSHGASAIQAAVMLMAELDRIGELMVTRGDPSGRFDPPCTTIHIGQVSGGTARNILANHCSFDWEFRGVPGLRRDEITERLDRFARETVIPRLTALGKQLTIETNCEEFDPGLSPEPGGLAERLALRLTGANQSVTVSYGSEAGYFQSAGISTILCGPGSMDQGHRPDEFITLDEIQRGAAFVQGLAHWCSGP